MPAPSFILALQLLSCAVFVRTLSAAGAVEAEPLTLAKARPFAVIVFGFIGTLYSNITSLKARASLGAYLEYLCFSYSIWAFGCSKYTLLIW